MPFTPVIPTNLQTNRFDLHDAILAMLAAFKAAHPGIVNQVWHARPAGPGEFPLVYLGAINEAVIHDSGLRQTTFTGTVVFVDTLAFAPETDERVNVFLDYMRDLFTANARIFTPGIFEETGVTDAELPWGPSVETTGTAIHWRYVIQEGRD